MGAPERDEPSAGGGFTPSPAAGAARPLVGARARRWTGWDELALTTLGLASLLALWWVGSRRTLFVPELGEVFSALPRFLVRGDIWVDVGATVRRVTVALAAAIVVGFGAAWLIVRGGLAGKVASRYVSITLGLPSTIAALLALFIFRRSETGVYVVVALITFPFVALTLVEGLRAADRRLDEMSAVYRVSRLEHVRHVWLPHLVPYTFAAVRNEYAHAWKVVVLAELFAVNSGMGARFARAFDRFLLVDVMHWLLLFIAILLVTEYLVLAPLERYVLRWRGLVRRGKAIDAVAA